MSTAAQKRPSYDDGLRATHHSMDENEEENINAPAQLPPQDPHFVHHLLFTFQNHGQFYLKSNSESLGGLLHTTHTD